MVASSDDIWRDAPKKAFAVRARWAEDHPEAVKGAVRALARAGQFCDAPENASYTGALLARQRYLDVDSHAVLSSLPGGAIASRNQSRFWRHAATFPWRSHALWFLAQMARWDLVGKMDHAALAERVYRPDIYRAALAPLGVDVPRADFKVEARTTRPGRWTLSRMRFPWAPTVSATASFSSRGRSSPPVRLAHCTNFVRKKYREPFCPSNCS